MKKLLLSTDHSGRLANGFRQYERVQRTTPSGRIYDVVTMVCRDGSGSIHVSELTRDAGRALRCLSRCEFGPRHTPSPQEP